MYIRKGKWHAKQGAVGGIKLKSGVESIYICYTYSDGILRKSRCSAGNISIAYEHVLLNMKSGMKG